LDLVLFFGVSRWLLPDGASHVRRLASVLAIALPALAVCALPLAFAVRAIFVVLILFPFTSVAWRRGLDAAEKAYLLERLGRLWGRKPSPVGNSVEGTHASSDVATSMV
jgi:hypothetical protein